MATEMLRKVDCRTIVKSVHMIQLTRLSKHPNRRYVSYA